MSNPSVSGRVYLDNAASTPIDERVIAAMTKALRANFGNPSATHSLGRNAKGVLETARKQIASYIGAQSKEIIFTSGGTEADNLAIRCAVRDLGVRHIITSPIEHKAVLSTSQEMAADGNVQIHMLNVDHQGVIDYFQLNDLAEKYQGALISLMHANNEIGTLLDYKRVSEIAKKNHCLFHSDTVQTMGHYAIDVVDFGADFLACSAHKLNGPKGVGFLYINKNLKIKGLMTGGGQERNIRPGTEDVAGIIGLQKALEIAVSELQEETERISSIRQYMKDRLEQTFPEIMFIGHTDPQMCLYTVLSCLLPPTDSNELLLFQLDMEGVCVSGGSACNSGASKVSHVLQAVGQADDRQAVRFSFGRFSTKDDIDFAIEGLKKVLTPSSVEA